MALSLKRATQTVEVIQSIIDRGNPGDRLPSEIELAAQLAVSRATVREALSRLWVQGLVTRRWGAGTFISEREDMPGNRFTSFFLDLEDVGSLPGRIAQAGHEPTLAAFEQATVVPPDWIVRELQLEPGEQLRYLERCIAIDDTPAILLRDYVPLQINGVSMDLHPLQNLHADFPTMFRQVGLRLVKQAATLDAQLPDRRAAELFGIGQDEPLLHARQRSYADTGEVVIWTDGYYLTEVTGTILVRTISN